MILDAQGRPVRRAIGYLRTWTAERAEGPTLDLVALDRIPAESNDAYEECHERRDSRVQKISKDAGA